MYVDDASGAVTEAWTGFQVAWTMARGYPGAFGRRVNAWYVWIPLCVLFVAAVPAAGAGGRRCCTSTCSCCSRSRSRWRSSTTRAIGLSVPLVYPLLRLPARADAAGRRGADGRARAAAPARARRRGWRSRVVFLVGFRVGLNVTDSNVIDVGYAGVIGAHQARARPARCTAAGRRTTPTATRTARSTTTRTCRSSAIFGWSGKWDDLPAAHAAAIVVRPADAARPVLPRAAHTRADARGRARLRVGARTRSRCTCSSSNSNDSLVALLVVLALLAIRSAPGARRWPGALAAFTKFAPLALAPLLARAAPGRAPREARRVLGVRAVRSSLTAVRRDAAGADSGTTCARVLARHDRLSRPTAARRSRSGACRAGSTPRSTLVQGAPRCCWRWSLAFVPAPRDVVDASPRWAPRC